MLALAFVSGLVVGVVATLQLGLDALAETNVAGVWQIARVFGVESRPREPFASFATRVAHVARERQATHENVERVMRRIHDGFDDETDDET